MAERIAFINPPSPQPGTIYIRDVNRSGRRSKERTIWPQTSLALMASVFQNDNVRIWDCIAENIDYYNLYKQLQEFNPTWVIFNPISSTVTYDMIVSHFGKSLGAKTVSVSPHTKALREESLSRYKSLDYAVDYTKGGNEPEYQLRELINGISANGTSFEQLPPARQDLLPIHKYSLPFIGKGYTFVVTSRGCPWACIYCRAPVMNERKVRFRPVETVIEEIRRYNLQNIAFHADTATMNRKWIYDFCDAVEKLPFKVRIVTNSRVDTVDQDMLYRMKASGFWMICYGVESGNDEVLRMNKKEATVEKARQAVRMAKRAGLRVWGYFMLGMFGDTRNTIDETIRLSQSESFDIVNFAISAPYPGTEWGRIAETNGWLVDTRWEAYDQNYSAQVSQPDCSIELVKEMQKKAYLQWYFSPRGLKFLASSFKPEYITYFLKTVRDHMEDYMKNEKKNKRNVSNNSKKSEFSEPKTMLDAFKNPIDSSNVNNLINPISPLNIL